MKKLENIIELKPEHRKYIGAMNTILQTKFNPYKNIFEPVSINVIDYKTANKFFIMNIKLIKYNSTEYKKSIELRDKILRKPLGMVFTEEYLARDENDFLIGLFKSENILATLNLTPLTPNRIKMRQVAVVHNLQGQGLGRKIVEFSETIARKNNYSIMELNARDTAVPFYKRLNYKIIGEKFVEVGIEHYKMEKKLTKL